MARPSIRLAAAVSIAWAIAASGCIAGPPLTLSRQTDVDGGTDVEVTFDAGAGADAKYEIDPADPHALVGVDPPHGPFTGGQPRIVRGNGFGPKVRVWFAGVEADPATVVPIDAERVQVAVPAGAPGPADVRAQNGDDESTARVLPGGYVYDAFYADPATGPTSGGTVMVLHGSGTGWDAGTAVAIDGKPCADAKVASPTEIACSTPKHTAGAKSVTTKSPGKDAVTVADAFTYADSDNGYKGGLSGPALSTKLKVIALDNYTGNAIPGAHVFAHRKGAPPLHATTDGAGLVLFSDPGLGPKRTVTIAAKCYQPQSFVDVPVDTVTAYLNPVLSPACSEGGDPPSVGGHSGQGATVTGELVWKGGVEWKKAGWTNVPSPTSPDEEMTAYVFVAGSNPNLPFDLPEASQAIRPTAPGGIGYKFTVSTGIGNLALYALAGLENRKVSPPKFTAYAMGVVQGVATVPGGTTKNVYIPMHYALDKALTVQVVAPKPGPRGPDRVRTSAVVGIGNDGFAILPVSQKVSLVPVVAPLVFVGLPPLQGALAQARYVGTARAGTGAMLGVPLSVMRLVGTTDASQKLVLDGFVPVPLLDVPPLNGAWDGTHLSVKFSPSTTSVDITVWDIESAAGLVGWVVAAPAGATAVDLPDLAAEAPGAGLVPGPVSITVYGAHIDGFKYGELRYRHLGSNGWNAYAAESYPAHLGP